MSVMNTTVWIQIRRYDIFEPDNVNCESNIQQATLPSHSTFLELKSIVLSWGKIRDNNSKLVKLRKYDNTLIPYSTLLQGSTQDKPFIIEITNVHQFCPVEERMISSDHVEALKSKFEDLEKRISAIEHSISKYPSMQRKRVEQAATQLANQVSYLTRRLEELTPSSWLI